MRILIVEDSKPKLRKILERLQGQGGLTRGEIDVAETGMAAREFLAANRYDLMLLDILVPFRAEDDANADTSLALIEEICEGDAVRAPSHILGITAFEEVLERVAPQFEEMLWHVIYADESSVDWLEKIERSVAYIKAAEEAPREPERKLDVLVLTALPKEHLAVRRLPWNWLTEEPYDDTTWISRGTIQVGDTSFSVGLVLLPRAGMVAACAVTSKLLLAMRPRVCAMAGICAGVRGKTNLGDVILADPAWDYQSGKHMVTADGESRFQIAPHQLPLSEAVRADGIRLANAHEDLGRIRRDWPTPPDQELRVQVGPVATGSSVCADAEVLSDVMTQLRTLIGIEMELYGVYAAVALSGAPRPVTFGLKGVSDFADVEKNDDCQAYAAYTSAEVLRLFVEANIRRWTS